MKSKPILRYFLEIAILAVVYHLTARVGLQMACVQQNTSPVWPHSGIALAALLVFGIRDWPGITLGVVIGSLLTGAPPGNGFGQCFERIRRWFYYTYAHFWHRQSVRKIREMHAKGGQRHFPYHHEPVVVML